MPSDGVPHKDDRSAVREEYGDRLALHQREGERQLRRFRRLAACRGVMVGLIIALALLGEKETPATRAALLVVPAALALAFMAGRRRAARAWQRAVRTADYYQDRLACLAGLWIGRGDAGVRYLAEDHPAALDLDLFGIGSLYQHLATPSTARGRDTLAAWLSGPAGADEVHGRQRSVRELACRLDLREDLAVRSTAVPGATPLADLARWACADAVTAGRATRWAILLAPVAALALVVAAVVMGTGEPLSAALAIQLGLAVTLHRYAGQTLQPLETARPALVPLAHLLARLERECFAAPRLTRLVAMLAGQRRAAAQSLRGLDRLLGLAIPATLLGCRPLLAQWLNRWRRRHGSDVGRWLGALGELEALAALATYTHENPDAIFPEVVAEHAGLDTDGLGHPLLPRERCVGNDVRLTAARRLLMVSGSNMSGKSTLLRAVGVNVALALAGAPVRARRMRLGPFVIGATLRVQDSLRAGRSRFYAEALRVRRLLQLAEGPTPVLFLLDELFQGTNSHDRQVGAEAILQRLLQRGAVGLVTTHDLALTEIADRLSPRAVNVHFEDHGADGSLAFDYRLRDGVVPSSNGLALLRAVGIEI
jgi:hypothetical protein